MSLPFGLGYNPMPNHNRDAWNAFQNNKIKTADILDVKFSQCILCKSHRLTIHLNYVECRDCGCQFFGIKYRDWDEYYEIYLYLGGEWIPFSKWKCGKRKVKIKVILI
jgi:hypothetical protein